MNAQAHLMQTDHHQALSAFASTFFDVERQLQSFSSSNGVALGTSNDDGRGIYNYYSYHFLSSSVRAPRPSANVNLWRETWRISTHQQRHGLITMSSKAFLSGYLAVELEGLAMALRLVDQRVQPHAAGVLGDIQQLLSNLSDFVVTASKIHDALGGSEWEDRVRVIIDERVTQCTLNISWVHQRLDRLVYRRLPILGLLYGYHDLLRRSQDRWGLGEIAYIRKQLSLEAQYFAEWLFSLGSFCWARRSLLRPQSQFAWDALNNFFAARQKEGLTLIIPNKLELICIFEPAKDGGVLTIAVLIASESAELGVCPKCGKEQDRHDASEGDTFQWTPCHTRLTCLESSSPNSHIEEVCEDNDEGTMVYSTIDDKSAAKDDAHAYLLEQMKIEMFRMLQEFQQSLPSSISGTGAYLTSLTINGGTFNVVGRDVHNHIYTYHIPKDDRKASIFTKLMGKLGWERKRYIKHHDTRSTHDASALPITASSPVLPVPDGNQQVTEILRQALCATPTTAGGPPMEKTKVGAATSKMTATFRAAAKASERAPTKGKNKAA